ncbi:hypothetical protein C3L21_32915 (plasmid) [Sinorhizobium meliloti]|nr:hypothetical protein C3L21_32915 [Sinorhizobium meliloti]
MSLLSCLSALRAHTIFAKWLSPSGKTSGLTRKGEDCLNRSQFGNAGNFGRGGVLSDNWQAWWPNDDDGGGDDSPLPEPLPEPA